MATKIKNYRVGNLSGLIRKDAHGGGTIPVELVQEGLDRALRTLETLCNVRFIEGSKGVLIHVKTVLSNPHRGTYTSKQIYLNSHIGDASTPEKKWNGNTDRQFYQIFAHELGHWLGLGHSKDKKSIMHSNASGIWLPADITKLKKKYGGGAAESHSVAKVMREVSKILKRKYKTKETQEQALLDAINTLTGALTILGEL